MTKKKSTRRNGRTKNGIKVSEIGSRRRLEVDFTVRVSGERIRFRRYSPFKTRAESYAWGEAERAAILEQAGRPKPRAPRADPGSPRSLSFWGKKWLGDASNPGRANGANRNGTIESKEGILRVHLEPYFGRRLATKIDEDAIEEYIRHKLVDDELAETTVALHLRHLRGLLNYIKRKGNRVERALELPENITLRRPRRRRVPPTLSEAQTDQFLAANFDHPPRYALLALLFRQGCRIGEVQALRWSAVDFETDTLTIAKSWDGNDFGDTKGGDVRRGPLHPQTRLALERLAVSEPWGLVFPGQRDPQRPASFRYQIERLRELCRELRDEEGERIHFVTRIGRHSLGRHWAERGLPLRSLQDLLGHASIEVTQIYMRWSSAETATHLRQIGTGRAVSVEELNARLRELGVKDSILRRAGMLPGDPEG